MKIDIKVATCRVNGFGGETISFPNADRTDQHFEWRETPKRIPSPSLLCRSVTTVAVYVLVKSPPNGRASGINQRALAAIITVATGTQLFIVILKNNARRKKYTKIDPVRVRSMRTKRSRGDDRGGRGLGEGECRQIAREKRSFTETALYHYNRSLYYYTRSILCTHTHTHI